MAIRWCARLIQPSGLTCSTAAIPGRCIIKVASERYAGLPEAERGAIYLARMIGVDTVAKTTVFRRV